MSDPPLTRYRMLDMGRAIVPEDREAIVATDGEWYAVAEAEPLLRELELLRTERAALNGDDALETSSHPLAARLRSLQDHHAVTEQKVLDLTRERDQALADLAQQAESSRQKEPSA